jgi:hypothetical protein
MCISNSVKPQITWYHTFQHCDVGTTLVSILKFLLLLTSLISILYLPAVFLQTTIRTAESGFGPQ